MTETFNIYCDESCHLENDDEPFMILGAVSCPSEKVIEAKHRIKDIKIRHDLNSLTELKWTKASPSKVACYIDLVDYFFDDDDLCFRAIICDKEKLRHIDFGQDHDDWYYKMYYQLLKWFLNDRNHYNIFLDIKDTRSGEKRHLLHDVLCNAKHDFDQNMLQNVQHVRSHESQILQLADVLIGAVGYANRDLKSSSAKRTLVGRIQQRSHLSLLKTNYSPKFNLFHWKGRDIE